MPLEDEDLHLRLAKLLLGAVRDDEALGLEQIVGDTWGEAWMIQIFCFVGMMDVKDREEVWYKGYSKDSKVLAGCRK